MAIYFDSFNRADTTSGAGTSDSQHAYSAISGYDAVGISSGKLYNPGATLAGTQFDVGVREFDITITLGDSGTGAKYAAFTFAGNAAWTEGISLVINNAGVLLYHGSDALATGATAVVDAASIRLRVTKSAISVWVGSTLQFTFYTTLAQTNTRCNWSFGPSSDVTIDAVTMEAIGYATKTASQLITRTRSLLNETDSTNSNVTNAELIEFFNQGLEELNNDLAMPIGQVSYTGAQFVNYEVTLPSDCYKVEEVRNQSVPLGGIRFSDRSYMTGIFRSVEERRAGYYIRDRVLGIPNVNTGDTITVYYRRAAMEVDTDTGPEIFQGFNNYLINYGLARAWEKIGDAEQSSMYDAKAEKAKGKAIESYLGREFTTRQIVEVC